AEVRPGNVGDVVPGAGVVDDPAGVIAGADKDVGGRAAGERDAVDSGGAVGEGVRVRAARHREGVAGRRHGAVVGNIRLAAGEHADVAVDGAVGAVEEGNRHARLADVAGDGPLAVVEGVVTGRLDDVAGELALVDDQRGVRVGGAGGVAEELGRAADR